MANVKISEISYVLVPVGYQNSSSSFCRIVWYNLSHKFSSQVYLCFFVIYFYTHVKPLATFRRILTRTSRWYPICECRNTIQCKTGLEASRGTVWPKYQYKNEISFMIKMEWNLIAVIMLEISVTESRAYILNSWNGWNEVMMKAVRSYMSWDDYRY